MALRSLVVMLKALPRRMPGSVAFAPKGNPWSKSSANATKLRYLDEILPKEDPLLYQKIIREESRKTGRLFDIYNVLIGIIGFGSMTHVATKI